MHRARRAARARELGYIGWHATDGVTVLVCPAAARAMLEGHDGGCPFMEKPDKLLLLEHALTGVSGETWARQRKAFQEAVAGGQGVQRRRHGGAAQSAAALARQYASIGRVRDVRELAAVVSARAVVCLLLGADGRGDSELEAALLGFRGAKGLAGAGVNMGPSPRASIDALLHGFADCVRARAEQAKAALADPAASGHDSAALLSRLLQRSDLHHEEVLDNAHSCLLAGFDTIMALVLCSILHLAQREEIQAEARQQLQGGEAQAPLVQSILRETLRRHPPVSSLPRRVLCEEGMELQGAIPAGVGLPDKDAHPSSQMPSASIVGTPTDRSTFLPQGTRVNIDLQAFIPCAKGAAWEPKRPEGPDPEPITAWGVGPRICPASNISMMLAGEVLQGLLVCFSWRLEKPETDARWFEELVCQPTLVMPRAVGVVFQPAADEPGMCDL